MVLDVFMALDAPAGTHTYELKYTPPGLRIGLVISACALLLTIAYLALGRKQIDLGFDRHAAAAEARRSKEQQKAAEETAAAAEEVTADDPL